MIKIEGFVLNLCLIIGLSLFSETESLTSQQTVYVHFKYKIPLSDFTSDSQQNVKISASINNKPDLPLWMKLHQKNQTSNAFLYGTASEEGLNGNTDHVIKLIGWNKNDYSTTEKLLTIEHISFDASYDMNLKKKDNNFFLDYFLTENVKYQLEFKLNNYNIEDVLETNTADLFLKNLQTIWPAASYVTKIERPLHRPGGRLPLPGAKEGVFIVTGGPSLAPASLLNAKYCIDNGESFKSGSEFIYTAIKSDFNVNWCQFKVLAPFDSTTSNAIDPTLDTSHFVNSTYQGTGYDSSKPKMTTELLYLIIPIGTGLLFIIGLSIVMCCYKDERKRRETATRREKMIHQRSLQRTDVELKRFSNLEQHEPEGRISYEELDNNGYHSNTLPRSDYDDEEDIIEIPSRPPPYKMPPSMHSETNSFESQPPSYRNRERRF